MKSFTSVAAGAFALATTVLASPAPVEPLFPRATSLPAVTVKGNAFFVGTSRFYIRGVDWQPGGSSNLADPLADVATCTRDIAQFKKLGSNTVRIYTVDNTANHDTCMQMLADAGIYLVLDVNSPLYSLRRDQPEISYNSVYLQNIFATIDAFAKYSNTMAFFSGNEVINDDTTTSAAPYIKAVTRDMRQYIRTRGYRSIPVGYSAADVDSNRMEMAEYMNCGTDDARSDFFAFNDYSWCDPSDFKTAGWDQKVKNFTGYGLPIFLSEYGCIKPGPRTFQEVASLYSTSMSGVYSGGLVYEYSEEAGNAGYGLGTIKDANTYVPGAGFTYLQTAYGKTSNPSGDGGYSPTQAVSTCPPQSPTWNVTWGSLLPAMPQGAVSLLANGAGKGVGLKGPGSQEAGSTAVATASPGSASVTAAAQLATSTKNAAPGGLRPLDLAPLYIGAVTLVSFVAGMAIL